MAVYKQQQYLHPLLRYGVSSAVAGLLLYGVVTGVLEGEHDSLVVSVIAPVIALAAVLILILLRLDLRISEKEVTYQLFPIELKTRRITANEIESVEVKPFRNILAYGGFGRRRRPWKKQVAYIMDWRQGLHIRTIDGRIRIFSVDDHPHLERFLEAHYAHQLKSEQ